MGTKTKILRNSLIPVVIVAMHFCAASVWATPVSISGTITPVSGYGEIHSASPIDVYIESADYFVGVFGFDAFPSDTDYKLQFGWIAESDYTGTSADWDKTLAMEVSYVSGTEGKAYTVVKGDSDPDTYGAIELADVLGGIDRAIELGDLLGGIDSLVIFTRDGDLDHDGYVQGGLGYPGSPTAKHEITPSDWTSVYLIAQVQDIGETGQSITVGGFTEVPEPATLCLFGFGGLLLRRRKKA